MPLSDEQLERLISREIDGEISPEEKLQLDRYTIRNPEAHALRDELRSLDRAAHEGTACARSECAEGAAIGFDPVEIVRANQRDRQRRPLRRGRWLVPLAVAASLALIVAFQSVWSGGAPNDDGRPPIAMTDPRSGPSLNDSKDEAVGMLQAVHGEPRRVHRNISRDWIGVPGENGDVYWIEMNRTRTLRSPAPAGDSAVRLASGQM